MQYMYITALLAFSVASPALAVAAGTAEIGFSPQSITIYGTETQSVTLSLLSAVPPGGLLVNLSSDNPGVAQVQPRAGFYPDGSAIGAIRIVAVGPGTTVIHAGTPPSVPDTTLRVTVIGPGAIPPVPITPPVTTPPIPVITPPVITPPVTPPPVVPPPTTAIFLPSGLTITPGQQMTFPVTLANPAPPGGVSITLSSSDTSRVAVSPMAVFIQPGATTTDTPVKITGISFGTAAISASANNSTGDTETVQVAPGTAALSFSPQNLTMAGTGVQNVTLALSSAVPSGGLVVNLSSANPAIAQVQPRAGFFPDGSAISQIPIVAVGSGTTVIHAGAPPNFPDTTLTVTVMGPGAITLPDGIILSPSQSAAFPVTLSTKAPAGGATITLISSDNNKAAISPASVFIVAGSTTPATQPQITALAVGSTTISASTPGYTSASQTVQIQPVQAGGTLSFSPASLMGGIGTNILQLNLSTPPAPGGLTVSLFSNNTGVVTVPPSVTFPANVSSLNLPVTGVGAGSTVIHASAAPGFPDTAATVKVVTSGMIGLPDNVSVAPGQSVPFPVILDPPAPPGGVILTLTSGDNSRVVVSPATIFIPQGATTPAVQAQLTGFDAGIVSVGASASGYTSATQNVQVQNTGASVKWYGACWQNYTFSGFTGNFQAIDFVLSTATPVPVQGSLFFAPNCDPSQGIDNLNDSGLLTPSRHMVQFFTHYPDTIPSSAIYWVGSRTSDGMCPVGSPCSGCVNYTKTTPDCGTLP